MNRFVVFGVAMFFAIVGIALLGAENKADAGQRCCGCSGASCGGCGGACTGCSCGGLFARRCCGAQACCGPRACCGPKDCCGLFARMRCCAQRCCARRCCGAPVTCCGCGGSTMSTEDAGGDADVPPAPEAASTIERSPLVFHSVSFRR